jgi:threonine dehydratase
MAVAREAVSAADVEDAARLIAGKVRETPVIPAGELSRRVGATVVLKAENLQLTGSFKARGATNMIGRLPADALRAGVVAASAGNHAQAVACAARDVGARAVLVMPEQAPVSKVAAVRQYGGEVRLHGGNYDDAHAEAARLVEAEGLTAVHAFDDAEVVAGQGTVGLEIAQDAPEVDTVLVPVSGGGLISGIAAALTALLPHVKVVGVEPELAGDAAESFRAGRRIPWTPAQTARTMADGLRTFSVGELPWQHISTQVHDIVTVTEDEIADATRRLLLEARLVAEPSGAVAAAAYLHHPERLPGGRTVAVLSGGNIDPAVLLALLSDA